MSSDTTTKGTRFHRHGLRDARIGANRELKRAVESYWKGQSDRATLEAVAASLRGETARQLRDAGFDSIPVSTFSYYDQMLDTAILLGALHHASPRSTTISTATSAVARGTAELAPLEMTSGSDTITTTWFPSCRRRPTTASTRRRCLPNSLGRRTSASTHDRW